MKKSAFYYYILPIIAMVLCLFYVKSAVHDVVFSDYIRIINTYLPDVGNPEKFFVPDVLTRIPVNYLARLVNVTFFGYRTTFDMVLGVLSLGFAGWCLGSYSKTHKIGAGWYLLLTFLMFSLNKWEMLINGTGWAHFLAVGLFYYHFIILDRVYRNEGRKYDHAKMILLPFIIILGTAGPYCASYVGILILAYIFYYFHLKQDRDQDRKKIITYGICAVIPFALYLWSNSYAVSDHAGATSQSILETIGQQPGLFLRFLLKSWGSILIGTEQIAKLKLPGGLVLLLGIMVLSMYLYAFGLNLKFRLYEKTIFPMILLLMGMANHGMVLISRWIFLKDNYGMSSRYALQYQIGILGIVLTITLLWKEIDKGWMKKAAALICFVILIGNAGTTLDEIRMAKHREQNFVDRYHYAMDVDQLDDDTLSKVFEYRMNEPGSGKRVRNALEILREHNWNVYRR